MQRMLAFSYTVGGRPQPDIPRTNLLLVWGAQPIYSGSSKGFLKQILDGKARGMKIVAIKPTMEPDVAIADLWVPIRPGTDAALALAMLNVIVNAKLYDRAFVEQWTYGFDELVAHIQKFTPNGLNQLPECRQRRSGRWRDCMPLPSPPPSMPATVWSTLRAATMRFGRSPF